MLEATHLKQILLLIANSEIVKIYKWVFIPIFSLQDGDRGYLEGLASRYADLFSTHYGDVLDHLEELRRHEWEEMSPRMRVLGGTGTPQTPPSASPGSLALNNLTTSHSQPIYVPGKYSVSLISITKILVY